VWTRKTRPELTVLDGLSHSLLRAVIATAVIGGSLSTARAAQPAATHTEGPPAPTEASPALPAGPALPAPDSSGRAENSSPSSAGRGWLSVSALATADVHVLFEGHDFGVAPLTIYNIPKGDYVVEGIYADGKHVSRPVTIDENVEAAVDLGMGVIGAPAPMPPGYFDEGRPRRARLSKILLGISGGMLAVGLTFGILEIKEHSDYESAPNNQSTLDALAHTGQRDAMIANIGFVACGATLIAAGVVALPLFLKREAPPSTTTAFSITPGPLRGSGIATFSRRF